MCSPASMVLTKDRVFWSTKTDSHEEIIREFKLRESDGRARVFVLRVEITPPGGDYSKPLGDWRYKTDQNGYTLPGWHDKERDERRTRDALKKWAKARLVLPGEHRTVNGDAHVYLLENSRAVLRENSRAVLRGNSSAKLWENSSAVLRGNSSAVLRGNSRADLWENSSITTFGKGHDIELHEGGIEIYRPDYGKAPVVYCAQ